MEGIRTRSLKQSRVFKATPHEVYEMLMGSDRHSMFLGDRGSISRRRGGRFSVYGGWITGSNLKLSRDREIVQRWREYDWPEGHYSVVRLKLERNGFGTKLILSHTGIPEGAYESTSAIWKDHYWRRMAAAFGFWAGLKRFS